MRGSARVRVTARVRVRLRVITVGSGFGFGFGFGFGLPVSMVPSCVSSGALTAMPKSVSLIPPM